MKKRIGIIFITILIAITAYALTSCGKLSGSEIDEDIYSNAIEIFSDKLTQGGVMIECSVTTKIEIADEKISEYKAAIRPYGEVAYEKLFYKNMIETITKTKAIVEENKAYYKTEVFSETNEDGNISSAKYINEYYIEKINNSVYQIEKDSSGKWILSSKKTHPNTSITVASEQLYTMKNLSMIKFITNYNFESFQYSDGRYNLKQSVIDEKNKAAESTSTDTNKYTYTYGNNSSCVVFNADKLYGGAAEEIDGSETWDGVFENDHEKITTKSTKTLKSSSQSAVSYGQKVSIPSYTK